MRGHFTAPRPTRQAPAAREGGFYRSDSGAPPRCRTRGAGRPTAGARARGAGGALPRGRVLCCAALFAEDRAPSRIRARGAAGRRRPAWQRRGRPRVGWPCAVHAPRRRPAACCSARPPPLLCCSTREAHAAAAPACCSDGCNNCADLFIIKCQEVEIV